jgi:hypothetical protein
MINRNWKGENQKWKEWRKRRNEKKNGIKKRMEKRERIVNFKIENGVIGIENSEKLLK